MKNFVVKNRALIYCPSDVNDWINNTILTPTPFLLDENTIRVYCGFRDMQGLSRLGFVDVSSENPQEIIKISEKPLLSLGDAGTFDDNGMILGDILKVDNVYYLYYVAFQIPQKAKFLAFTGLATSTDGFNFQKLSSAPIMDRADNAPYIRAIHTVIYEEGRFKVWYSVGDGWEVINGLPYPRYHIHYTESQDGIHFNDDKGVHCIGVSNSEYRIGRPRVFKSGGLYHMLFTYDTLEKNYKVGYASSRDGITWVRHDDSFPFDASNHGWDSEMVCYPVPLFTAEKIYLFYSGNGMGRTGLGCATLVIS